MVVRGPASDSGWAGPAVAGFSYFAVVFCVGFALGAVRNLVVAPLIGEVSAVCLEAPLMLVVSWMVCGWALRTFAVDRRIAARVGMAAIAFGMLMVAEGAVGAFVFARDPITMLQTTTTLAGAIGLASQVGFGLIPLARRGLTGPWS